MAYNDQLPLYEAEPMLPQMGSGGGATTGQDPATMEQLFNPGRQEPPQGMPRGEPMNVADASGKVPLPTRGDPQTTPDMPEKRPEGANMEGLVKTDDSRYKDPQNLLMGNVMTGGMLPWAQAATDVASGRVPMEKFDEVRMEHQRKLEELKAQHPEFVAAAEKAMPFLEGLGMSVMKPARTVVGTMARGAAAAAPQGGARGYSSGPVEEPSVSGNRAASALGGAATDAAIGAGGAAVGSLIGKTTSVFQERAARAKIETETQRLDNDARKAAATVADKKAATVAKTAETKRLKGMDKAYEAESAQIAEKYKALQGMPEGGGLSKHWENNRKVFAQDPQHAFDAAAQAGHGLEDMSRALNLPPSVILSRLGGKQVKIKTPEHKRLMEDMVEADRIGREFRQRGLSVPANAAKPTATQPEAAKPAATPKPAAQPKAPKAPAAPKTPKASKPSTPSKPRKSSSDTIERGPRPTPGRPQGRK